MPKGTCLGHRGKHLAMILPHWSLFSPRLEHSSSYPRIGSKVGAVALVPRGFYYRGLRFQHGEP